jgi:hypothetical protein
MASEKTKAQPRGIDPSVQAKIESFCRRYHCPPSAVIELIELALKPSAEIALSLMTLSNIKAAVAKSWGKKSYAELTKDADWKIYHGNSGLKGQLRSTWEHYYREWVALPSDERQHTADYGIINGIDIFKNFRPWEVFGINKENGTREEVLTAYKTLAKQYHPDTGKNGGDRRIFEKLTEMRDSLMIIF